MNSISRWSGTYSYNPAVAVDEADPYVLPVVVKQDASASHENIVIAVARGIALILSDSQWDEQIEQWNSMRFRKVVRRAKTSKWEKIASSYNGVISTYKESTAFILPPSPVSKTPCDIVRLQVSGLNLPPGGGKRTAIPRVPYLEVSVNPELNMSTGKSCAQAGHAVHLAILSSPKNVLSQWQAHGLEVRLGSWLEDPDIIVHDAGFTEVAPNSVTAQATWRM